MSAAVPWDCACGEVVAVATGGEDDDDVVVLGGVAVDGDVMTTVGGEAGGRRFEPIIIQ